VVEPVRLAPSRLLFDVTRVASLRKGLGYPATALKIIGFWSAIFLGAYLSDLVGLAFAVIVTLLTPGCASLIAKRLRSGCTWAVAWAVIWWVLFAAFLVGDFFSKHQEISGYSIFFAALVVAPLYFLARGLFAFVAYRAEKRNGRSLTDPLAVICLLDGKLCSSCFIRHRVLRYCEAIMIDISYMDGASANAHRIAQGLVRKCEVVHSGKTTRGLGQEEPRAGYMLSPPPGRFPPPCSGLIPVLPCEEAADEVPASGIRTSQTYLKFPDQTAWVSLSVG
jgi:uncharacterized membrane protein YGL010W